MKAAIKQMTQIMKTLPEEKQREIIDFAEYLRFREIEDAGLTSQVVEGIRQVKARKYRSARSLLNEI